MAAGEVGEDLPARERRRLEQLGEGYRLRLRALSPHVVAEDDRGAAGRAEPPRDRLHALRARRRHALDAIAGVLTDLGLEPFLVQQRGADREVDGAGRIRGGLAERARGGHGDGGRIGAHLIGAARVLHERPHGLSLAQAGEGREPAKVLQLGHPVAGDDEQRGARVLGIEELPGELIGAAHHVRDHHPDLAAHPVIAVGHGGDEALVLGHHQPRLAGLGQRREDAGLSRARIGEQVVYPRVLEGLDEEHAAGAGDGLSHGILSTADLGESYSRAGRSARDLARAWRRRA